MVLELSAILPVVGSVGLAVVGWLVLRAINNVDEAIKKLSAKVDALSAQDTKILVEVADLRRRVMQLEFIVLRHVQIPDSPRDTE